MFSKVIITGVAIILVSALVDSADYGAAIRSVLDRFNKKLIKKGERRSPTHVKVSLIPRTEDFREKESWSVDSVMKLLNKVKDSHPATDVVDVMKVVFELASDPTSKKKVPEAVLRVNGQEDEDQDDVQISLRKIIELIRPENIIEWIKDVAIRPGRDENNEGLAVVVGEGDEATGGEVSSGFNFWGGGSGGSSFWGEDSRGFVPKDPAERSVHFLYNKGFFFFTQVSNDTERGSGRRKS